MNEHYRHDEATVNIDRNQRVPSFNTRLRSLMQHIPIISIISSSSSLATFSGSDAPKTAEASTNVEGNNRGNSGLTAVHVLQRSPGSGCLQSFCLGKGLTLPPLGPGFSQFPDQSRRLIRSPVQLKSLCCLLVLHHSTLEKCLNT
jgi:hypothetical protein